MVHTGRALGAMCWGWVFLTAGASMPFIAAGAALFAALAVFLAVPRDLLPPG